MSSPPAPPQSQRGLLVFIAVMAIAFCLSLAALIYLVVSGENRRHSPLPPGATGPIARVDPAPTSSDPLQPDDFALGLSIPPFEVIDQNEKPVTNNVFKGHVTVVDFFFTNCPFICPMMTGRFAALAEKLKDVPDVQLLSFSVDPAHDTPAQLRDYAKRFEADPARWRFLTGKQEVVWSILIDGLKWGIEERAEQPINLPDGSKMSNIRHPGWFALIGPDAKVLGIYQYDSEEKQAQLVQRIQAISRRLNNR